MCLSIMSSIACLFCLSLIISNFLIHNCGCGIQIRQIQHAKRIVDDKIVEFKKQVAKFEVSHNEYIEESANSVELTWVIAGEKEL